MRVAAVHDGPLAVVRLSGRLDGESARHLSDTIEDMLREGARTIEIDMSRVDYLSSAGLRVLNQRATDLTNLRGSLHVVTPSPTAREMLDAAGLTPGLVRETGATRISGTSGFTHWGFPGVNAPHASYEVSRYNDDGVQCRLYGPGIRPPWEPVTAAQCRPVVFHPGSFGIGIGALGTAFEDTGPRFGELIVAEGVATYLPTEGAHTPDYQLNYAARPPRAVLASGIVWDGLFSDLMRFSAHPDADEVPLAEIADVCVQMTGDTVTAIAVVAEMQALVGASLRRSPGLPDAGLAAGAGAGDVREWLSFTPEPAYPGTTALIVGVVARAPREPLLQHLRPIGGKADLHAHLHAAIFPYMPVPQRTVMLPSLITRLFTESAPRDVLHLLHDDRGKDAAGSTGLLRGVAWMARVNSVEVVA